MILEFENSITDVIDELSNDIDYIVHKELLEEYKEKQCPISEIAIKADIAETIATHMVHNETISTQNANFLQVISPVNGHKSLELCLCMDKIDITNDGIKTSQEMYPFDSNNDLINKNTNENISYNSF